MQCDFRALHDAFVQSSVFKYIVSAEEILSFILYHAFLANTLTAYSVEFSMLRPTIVE